MIYTTSVFSDVSILVIILRILCFDDCYIIRGLCDSLRRKDKWVDERHVQECQVAMVSGEYGVGTDEDVCSHIALALLA